MNVLMTTRYGLDHPGGVETVARELVPAMRSQRPGWRIEHCQAFKDSGGVARWPLAGDIVSSARLAIDVIRSRCDVVVVHGAEYAWAPLLIRRFVRRGVVVVWHGTRAQELDYVQLRDDWMKPLVSLLKVIYRIMERAACRADHLIAVSRPVAEQVERSYRPSRSVHVIPNGVDLNSGLVPGASTGRLLWVGTSATKKGLDIALQAFDLAHGSNPRLRFEIVGLKTGVNNDDAEGVHWNGSLKPNEMGEVYSSGVDILLYPTRYDPCPMVVLEAMSHGIAVVGSPVVEWLVGDAGIIVKDWDPYSYAQAVNQLVLRPDELADLRRRAMSRVRNFSWHGAAGRYLGVIDDIAAGPS
jgi:glycosyltransferase involved in cell wall biosynthesis